jgi:hydroxymethylbilane synthase
MAERPLRLGTRGSALALAQARQVAKLLGEDAVEIVTIKTDDQAPDQDKARFVRAIEQALLDGEVEIGVHSAKDLPSELPEGLEIAGVPRRQDPRDAYVGRISEPGGAPEGARIGTSALRRRAQFLAQRPDVEVVELRGNVDTRLRRLEDGDFDGLILAAAAMYRLGRAEEMFPIDPEEMTPAPGQGALALEVLHSNDRAAGAAESITDREALATVHAERALVASLDASCNTPLGGLATLERVGRLRIRAFCGLPDGSEWLRDEVETDGSDPEGVGRELAERLKAAGAEDLLRRAEEMAIA